MYDIFYVSVRADKRACSLGSVPWRTHLLKRTLILNPFGSNKHPAVSEGQLLHCCAPELLEQLPSLLVHPVSRGELEVNIGYFKRMENTGSLCPNIYNTNME